MNQKKVRLNDGYAEIYAVKKKETNFNAKISAKTLDDLDYMMDMAYEEQYRREQDYDFAESSGHALSLKVKMRLFEDIKQEYKVVIDSTIYNILKVDYAKAERSMYLYLEEERTIVK